MIDNVKDTELVMNYRTKKYGDPDMYVKVVLKHVDITCEHLPGGEMEVKLSISNDNEADIQVMYSKNDLSNVDMSNFKLVEEGTVEMTPDGLKHTLIKSENVKMDDGCFSVKLPNEEEHTN